jgi:thioredoxin-like negative regulator of GroEL
MSYRVDRAASGRVDVSGEGNGQESHGSMAEKSRRRLMLERSLEENPEDAFLRYGLAMQCLREGDVAEGRQRLRSLIDDDPDRQIAAYQQLGQSYADSGEPDEAVAVLRLGIAKARAAGDGHAAAEMEQLVDALG